MHDHMVWADIVQQSENIGEDAEWGKHVKNHFGSFK